MLLILTYMKENVIIFISHQNYSVSKTENVSNVSNWIALNYCFHVTIIFYPADAIVFISETKMINIISNLLYNKEERSPAWYLINVIKLKAEPMQPTQACVCLIYDMRVTWWMRAGRIE